jgi:hypothetical protein
LKADNYTRLGTLRPKTVGRYRIAVCHNCGKRFNKPGDWAYFYREKPYCSYSCMRVPQRKDEEEAAERKRIRFEDERKRREEAEKKKKKVDIWHQIAQTEARIETCLHWLDVYEERARNTKRTSREGKNARNCFYDWKRRLAESRQKLNELIIAKEAHKNVQEADAGYGQGHAAQDA